MPSEYLVRVFSEFDLQARAVANIVDMTQFSYRERRPLRPHLICTRGFHPYYGIDVVVRAFAEVKKQIPEARLDLLGGGSSEVEIRNLVRDLNLNGVRFVGVVSREKIGRVVSYASFFAGAPFLSRRFEPAVVTTPFMSMLSFTASFNWWLFVAGAQ